MNGSTSGSRFCLLVLGYLFLTSHSVLASHSMGADLTYECVGGNTYKIRLSFYRDCSGVTEPANAVIDITSASCGQSLSVTCTKIPGTGQEITPLCPSAVSTCNGGVYTGIEEWIYEGTVTLPMQCTDWVFSFGLCCRNSAITTISSPGSNDFFIYSTLNNTISPCNSSPTFSNKPVPFVCLGQEFCFNHGAYDADGDSLVYSLITPLQSTSTTVTYLNPYNATQPINSVPAVQFSSANGDICMTPQQLEITVMAVLVQEYRNGLLIGSVERDIQVTVINCNNNLPSMSGINGTTDVSATICAGLPFCFDVFSNDVDAGQNVYIDYDQSIPGAAFSTTSGQHPVGTFCWTPATTDISATPYCFTITVYDDACPYYGYQIFSYCLTVTGVTADAGPDQVTGCDGMAVITGSGGGGNPPYSYQWSTGETTPSINAGPGTYTLTVSDGVCTNQDVVAVNLLPVPVAGTTPGIVSCNGGSDGSVTINANGGTGAIQYSLDNGTTWQAGNVFTGLIAGNYSILVQDANGCTAATSAIITEPTPVVISLASQNSTCSQSNGSVTATAGGGTGAIQYSIDNGASWQASNVFNGLTAATYNILVQDANGCTATSSTTVPDEPSPTVSATPVTNVSCNAGSDGTITVSSNGGTGAIQYSIDNGITYQPGNLFSGLPAGNYSITIQDANGCTATVNAVITEPTPVVVSLASQNSTCSQSNGSVTATAGGGTGAIQYSIDNGASWQASNVFNGLAAATYNILVQDANGCTATSSTTVPDEPSPTVTATPVTIVSCNSGSDGTITVNSNGGTGAIQYSIDNGVTYQPGNLFNGLPAGNYSITIQDANGCTATANTAITEPTPVLISLASQNSTCSQSNGSVTATAGGGTGAIQYSIDNGASWQPSNVFNGLAAANYNILVQDANGCTANSSITVPDEPSPSVSSTPVTDVSCNAGSDGTITVNSSGGTGAIQYSIDNGVTYQSGNLFSGLPAGNYSITIQDANGCTATANAVITEPTPVVVSLASQNSTCSQSNGSVTATAGGGTGAIQYSMNNGASWQPSSVFNGLAAANYTILVKDAHGCTANSSITVPDEPSPTVTTTPVTDVSCNTGSDGTITVNAIGGTGAIQYSIDNGVSYQSGNLFSGLPAGNYSITIQDANGCTATANTAITEPTPVLISLASQNSTCSQSNGSVTATAGGGTGAIQYSIDNGASWQASNVFNGLAAATYNILVQDANGCTATSSIAVPDEPSPTVSATPVTNVSCNTGSDGTITVNSIGGTGAIQYSIDNGVTYQPGNLFSGLPAGNYSITILDANGCTATANTVISEPPAIVLNASTVDATCNGSNGFINAGGNGGTGALQFSINGGLSFQPGGTFGGLPAGNYLITVQDANGCQDSIVASVSNAQAPVIASVLAVHVTCNSGNDGSVTINAVGGTGTLEYSIDNGNTFQAGNSFTGLPAGNYDVVVRDANGCLSTSGVQVTEPPALSLSAAPVTSTCGNSNGSITITAGGGTGSIQYSNDNGTAWQSSPAFGGLAAGSYAIVVQDDNGCTETMNVNVPGAPSPVIAAVPVTDVTCNSGTNGSIAINSNGGTGAIQYSIDNGVTFQAGNVFGGLQAGNYQVLIQDANGCTDATTAVIAEPTPLALSATSIDATCNGSNGTITVNGGGGTGSIQFSINGGVSFQPGTSFNGLMAGNYTIIAQDANGCIDSIAVVVNNALAPVIASVQLVDVTCHSGNNGSVTINANGGTGLLQYSIDNGNTFQGLNVFANLPAGIYDIAVRDANGCLATSSAQITEPDPVTFTASPATETCGDGNGSVTLSATGGTGTLQYSLDGGVTFQPQNQFTGLAAGNYQIVIQDANGCTASGSTLVSNAPSPTIVSVNTSNLICFQSGNGSITITASGGSGSLQFSINGGINSQAGGNFTNLAAGNYSLVVTDTNGCEAISSAIITQPDPVVFSASTIQALCGGSNGSISLSASGGVGNYLFSIDSGMTFQPGSVFTGLASGNYQVFVQDNSGCTASGMVPVSNAQAPVITSTALHDASCYGMNDGEITIVASGGSGALSYSINGGVTWQLGNLFANIPAGTYSIVVADTNGCLATSPAVIAEPPQIVFSSVTVGSTCGNADGSVTLTASGGTGILQYSIDGGNTMQSASVFSNIGAGNYSIVIQDATGCLANGIASVSNTNGPVITVTVPSGLTCFGSNDGSISVVANGGVGTLNYSIDNGVTFQASGTFAGLAGGTYAIVVLDSNNCIATDGVLIHEPDPVQFNTLVTDATCGDLNGVIEVIATGGTGTLQFSNNNGTAFQQDTIFMNLSPGNYFMVVQDANGCSVTSQVSVADLASPVISLVNTTDVSCHGGNDGAATIGISGGTAPFLYQWSNAAASQLIGGITAGNYTVTVTDANQCTVTQVLTITEPSQLTAVTLSTPVNCYGWHNGSLSATPAGGTAPYYYLWSTGWAGQTESGLGAGVYSVIITDDHGCTVSVTDSVATPSVVTISSSAVHVDCAGNNNGSVHTMVTGGTAPYTYLWSTGATTSSINGLPGGTYQVTVTDDHNCIKYKITGVSEPPPLVLNVSQPDTICITQQATIWAAASGGTAPYTYQWSNNQSVNMQTVAPSATATYLVHVTDANGCTVPNQPVTVYVNPPLVVVASPDDAICDGEHLSIAAVASGGNGGPYAYSWSNGAGTNSSTLVSPQQTTTYIVTVTDQCGTPQAMDDVTVTVHPMPQVAFSLNPPSGCIPLEVSFVDQSVTDAGSHYVWDFGDGHYDTMYVNPVHTYYEPGTYSVGLTITTPFGCTSELVKPDVIQAWPLPVAGFTPDPAKTSILDPRIQFSDQSQGATQWRWEFGDLYGSSTEQFPVHIYRDTGTYQVTQFVLNQYGCRDTAYGEVVILGDFTIYVPNAFTPNGDGVNEYFFPQGIGITGLSMLIFDRWGQQVFATGSMTNPWDGTNNRDNSQCVQDVYVYLIRATDLHGRGHEFTGRVSLIR